MVAIRTATDLGALLRDRRRALGLDQATVAARVGVSRQWVSQVEHGKEGVPLGLVFRALKALDVTLIVDDSPPMRHADQPSSARPMVAPIPEVDLDAIVRAARRPR